VIYIYVIGFIAMKTEESQILLFKDYWDEEYPDRTDYIDFAMSSLRNTFSAPIVNYLRIRPWHECINDIKNNLLQDLIYDQKAGLVVDGAGNAHKSIVPGIYIAHKIVELAPESILSKRPERLSLSAAILQNTTFCDPALAYINEYGAFQSSVSGKSILEIGEDLILGNAEQTVFGNYQIVRTKYHDDAKMAYLDIMKKARVELPSG
tara:strand:+ start:25605 stop:26225 length:621 start_codon:yes stop_codon:yes gene_type:complete